jgi:exopolyphosphatase/guanosine-5'-triphosphate,3'-diphosphate pyrophosphatase
LKEAPKRIAAIDIGTNSFHLIVVEVKENGKVKFLDRERVFLRLGTGIKDGKSFISDSDLSQAILSLKKFSKILKYYKAEVRAVATSAVREASNNSEFVNRVLQETGITVEIIDGKTEAKLIFTGMKNALPIKDKSVLGIDIGGGSTEFIHAIDGKTQFTESVKVGAVRLSKMFFPNFIITNESVKNCEEYVADQIFSNKNILKDIILDFAIGSSGTVDTICLVKEYQQKGKVPKELNGYEFYKTEFDEVYNLIMNLKSSDERMRIPGIESKRADVIPAGMIILKQAFKIFNIKKMVLSEFALREGIVFDLIEQNE